MNSYVGLLGTFLPLLGTIVAGLGTFGGRSLWLLSLLANLLAMLCLLILVAGFYSSGTGYDGIVTSPVVLDGSAWSPASGMHWVFHDAALALSVAMIVVSFHFIARRSLEDSRATVGSLGAYATCLIGALGTDNLLLFATFFAGSMLPRFIFSGVDAAPSRIGTVREAAFLTISAVLSLILCVLAFSGEFRPTLNEWFLLNGQHHFVLPGAIGLSLLLFAAAIGAGFFPIHGSGRRIFEAETIERAVPLALSPLFGFILLTRFAPLLFPAELVRFSPYLLGIFSVGALYCALCFMGAKQGRERVYWLQKAMGAFVAIGLFSLDPKGWHGALILLLFQTLVIPFVLFVLICQERRGPIPLARVKDYPLFAFSAATAALSALFLPISMGFYGVLFVIWALAGKFDWPLLVTLISVPIIAFAGMNILFFRLEEAGSGARGDFHDLVMEEVAAIAPLGFILLLFGFLPKLLLGPIGSSVASVLKGLGL